MPLLSSYKSKFRTFFNWKNKLYNCRWLNKSYSSLQITKHSCVCAGSGKISIYKRAKDGTIYQCNDVEHRYDFEFNSIIMDFIHWNNIMISLNKYVFIFNILNST